MCGVVPPQYPTFVCSICMITKEDVFDPAKDNSCYLLRTENARKLAFSTLQSTDAVRVNTGFHPSPFKVPNLSVFTYAHILITQATIKHTKT